MARIGRQLPGGAGGQQKNLINLIKIMSPFKYLFCTSILIAFSVFPSIAHAADIYIEKFTVNLIGDIRSGDAERLASLIASDREKKVFRLIINSNGGDLQEAMRIKDLVNGLHIGVRVAKGGYCISACFFIFLEGYQRHASWGLDDGTLFPKEKRDQLMGVVGIHRPYLKSPTGDVMGTKKQQDLMRSVRDYLAAKVVPQHLIDEMMARPSNDVYWLKEKDLNLLGELSPGDEEALIARCGYKRFRAIYGEKWSDEKRILLEDCMFDYHDEQYLPIQLQYIMKLRTGWRPWLKK